MAERARVIVTTSWDDGDPLDAKLADVLSEYGIKGTFYYAPRNRERKVMGASELRRIAERFEIGGHTLTHPDLRGLSDAKLKEEVSGGKQELESILGAPVRTFCYPKGKFNARIRRAVVDAGFEAARTTRSFLFDVKDPFRMPVTFWARDLIWPWWFAHCARSRSWRGFGALADWDFAKPWWKLAAELFDDALRHGGIWHLWGHSWELQERSLWSEFCHLLDVVSRRDDVVYMTNGEVARMGGEAAKME
jgi:hypothetical protein